MLIAVRLKEYVSSSLKPILARWDRKSLDFDAVEYLFVVIKVAVRPKQSSTKTIYNTQKTRILGFYLIYYQTLNLKKRNWN